MENNTLRRLVEQAKQDPQFFHDLVFKSEETLKKLDFLTHDQKAALRLSTPEYLLSSMLVRFPKGVCSCQNSCGITCGNSCC